MWSSRVVSGEYGSLRDRIWDKAHGRRIINVFNGVNGV
jgi:hypothetical protein